MAEQEAPAPDSGSQAEAISAMENQVRQMELAQQQQQRQLHQQRKNKLLGGAQLGSQYDPSSTGWMHANDFIEGMLELERL